MCMCVSKYKASSVLKKSCPNWKKKFKALTICCIYTKIWTHQKQNFWFLNICTENQLYDADVHLWVSKLAYARQ